jgi:hypothetical protein
MIKRISLSVIFLIGMLTSAYSQATGLADLKFGRYQIADSQWNVGACMYTATCEIYSTNPGTAYKIPWTSGQLSWAAGDYVSFVATGDATNPWNAIQYASNGVQKSVMGTGHIINMGTDYFFFVGNDNNTGQLFSMTSGLSSSTGMTWTGTLNPTVAQVNAYATNGSTAPLGAGQTSGPPPLCCGGSAASFNASTTHIAKIQSFAVRTTQDSTVQIEQIGNSNTITVDQTGTPNNYVKYDGNGTNNNITITQSGNASTAVNYVDLKVIGNTNSITTTQQSTGGSKGIFATVNDDNNVVTVQQKDNGSHYLSLNLSGGNKTVDVLQQGSANHMANITLTGQPSGVQLNQSGSTQQFYSITHNCGTAGGCAPIQVQQGR